MKKPPTIARSPYKGRLTRRPHHSPQVPTRGEQINAAVAFVPQLDFGPIITNKSTVPAQTAAGSQAATHGSLSPDSVNAAPADSAVPIPSLHTQADQVDVSSTILVNSNAVSKVPVAVGTPTDDVGTGKIKPQGKITTLQPLECLHHVRCVCLPQLRHRRLTH